MPSAGERAQTGALRVVLVGTGTGIGKTHVACALLARWRATRTVAGLKPIETGVSPATSPSPQTMRATRAGRPARGLSAGHGAPASEREADSKARRHRGDEEATDQERLANAAEVFHVKRMRRGAVLAAGHPVRSLYTFPEPISPHLAARLAGIRIDLGLVERWVDLYAASTTIIETAGGLFSPLGYGATNFDLMLALRPHAVILVAPDRLGVLHELTTTLALSAARGGPALGVVLSAPAKRDASTGRNARELVELGIASPLATFPRSGPSAAPSAEAAGHVVAWVESTHGADNTATVAASARPGRRAARRRHETGRD
jgi:dethiobiotin synthetase